jgi:hypothetical protein
VTERRLRYGPGRRQQHKYRSGELHRLDNGTAPDRIGLTAQNGRIDRRRLIETTQLDASATDRYRADRRRRGQQLVPVDRCRSISGRNFVSDGDIDLQASGSITVASADAGNSIGLQAGTIDVGSAKAGAQHLRERRIGRFRQRRHHLRFSGEGGSGITVSQPATSTSTTPIPRPSSCRGRYITGGSLKRRRT